jgi:hypothetical protein
MSLLGMPMTWVAQDLVVIALAVATVAYVIRREERPLPVVLEMVFFVFLYAGAYENIGTALPLYHYGRSLLMIGNVPVTVPIIEYLVVYAALRMLGAMRMPTWSKPIVVGFFGMLQDFTLDPLAVRQVFDTAGGLVGRWSWVKGAADVNILGVPVFNFPGWMLILGYGAAFILLGRWWFERSGRRTLVGWLYPVLSMLAALLLLVSPVSQFLLWLAPFFAKGSPVEWVLLGVHLALPVGLLAFAWRGRMKRRLSIREDWPVFVVPAALHLSDLAATLAGGYWQILWLVVPVAGLHAGILLAVFLRGQQVRRRAAVRGRPTRRTATA